MAVNVPAQYQQWVATAARGTGLPPAVVAAQINQESGFNPRATSPTGAQGIAQFEPATWRSQGVPGSPYDPNAALRGYIKLMGTLLHQYGGNVSNALAAYNAGPGNLPAGMGYARTILSNAGGGGASSSVRPIPGMPAQQTSTGGVQSSIQVPYTTQSFDQAGYNQAQRGYIAGSFLKSPGANPFGGNAGLSSLFQAGRLSSAPPNVQDFVSQQTQMQTIKLKDATSQLQGLAGQPLVNVHASGVANFGGKPIAAWIAPILQYAKQHGWSGGITSGYRTLAQQQAIYNSGVRPAAKPGTSNHEFTAFPGGAVDVTNAQQLAAILQNSPYRNTLVWAGSKDPVHFSHPHNGGY